MNPRKPDFFIVGAAKAGTTALYALLSRHPQVYMSPIKEPNYFSKDINLELLRPQVKERLRAENLDAYFRDGMKRILHRAYIRDEATYLRLFAPASADKKAGEASASYLYSTLAAEEIKKFNPQARIIIILREPAARAYSHFLMDRKLGFVNDDFTTALRNDAAFTPKGWGANSLYRELGHYYGQVQRYLHAFPAGQVLILLQEDLMNEQQETLQKICRFIGVNENFLAPDSGFRNESAVPSGKIAALLLRSGTLRVKLRNLLEHTPFKKVLLKLLYRKPELTESDRETLQALRKEYKTEIEQLAALIDRDLHTWLR